MNLLPSKSRSSLFWLLASGFWLLFATTANAQWQTLNFDVTTIDGNTYTTDIPASAFTANGLKLPLKPGATYTLTSKKLFSGDFSFELQQSATGTPEKSMAYSIDLVLINNDKQRKAVGTYTQNGGKVWGGDIWGDRCEFRYLKDGKPAGVQWKGKWCEASAMTGSKEDGAMEWLRIHKADRKLWFLQEFAADAYRWAPLANDPPTNYFQEDCDSYQVGIVVRCNAQAAGTLLIKKLRISGTNVAPRDTQKREYHFDFGPVNQELEDDFDPVSEYTTYSKEKGFGWVIPDPENVIMGGAWGDHDVPSLTDEEIAAAGFQPITANTTEGLKSSIRKTYWMQLHDKKSFYSASCGKSWSDYFQKRLDLCTPLERDFVGMAKPYHFSIDRRYQKDADERRGSEYIDDDLSAEFVVDQPNGDYNLILGIGYAPSFMASEHSSFNVEVNGRVRKPGMRPFWRRCDQFPVRGVTVENGQMRIRFFCNLRGAMDRYDNSEIGTGWMINYLLILPADNRELMSQWEWKIIKRRAEVVRRMTFAPGDPAITRNEGRLPTTQPSGSATDQAGQTGFLTLNGKPWYYLNLLNNHIPGTTNHYPYYCLTNCLQSVTKTASSKQFFKPDWEKLSYSDDYPWDVIDDLNTTYSWGCVASLAHWDMLSFVPQTVQGEGNPTVDSRGRRNRYNLQPPLNSALGHEIQREAYTMMSNQLAMHPAVAAHFIYEELWHPDEQGYDDQSILQFWGWLRDKYGTIESLNQAWGRDYKQWEDIEPPTQAMGEWWQFTPEFVNFRDFQSWAQQQMIKSAVDVMHQKEPDHFTWGAKGDYGTQSWYPGEYLDGFGWYTPRVAASVSRHFGKTAIAGGYHMMAETAYTDGRKQFDYPPGPVRRQGQEEANVYNRLISRVFMGIKGFWVEWHCFGPDDAFYRTDLFKRDGPKHILKIWNGSIFLFEDGAYEGPPVRMERHALYADRANQMLYRLGQLWLPAAPLEPKVLVPMTQESYFLNFFGPKPDYIFETLTTRILRSSNLPMDFMAMSAAKDLSQYQMIVLGDVSQAISKSDAQRIRKFVNDGGKLIIMNGGGFSDDTQPRHYEAKKDEVYPLEEFADLGGYTLEAADAYHTEYKNVSVRFAACDIAPEIPEGKPLGSYTIPCYYVPRPGSQVFLKGRLPDNREVALGILNSKRNVAVVNFPPMNVAGDASAEFRGLDYGPKNPGDEIVHPLSLWFRHLIDTWKIDRRVTLGGVDDAWNIYSSCLTGDGYTLATVCNFDSDKPQKLSLKLNFLPAGDYAVIDATGERPDLAKKPDGGWTFKSDPVARETKIVCRLSAEQLAKEGIPCEVPATQAKVFLIRPLEPKVWVSIWKPWLKSFVEHPVTIAYGTAAADKAGAEDIRAALAKVGIKATVVAAADVKHKKLHHDVLINPFAVTLREVDKKGEKYLVDAFDNEVVDSDDNFLAVGSTQTNTLMQLWCKENSFVYDKVLEKITASYPGPGRGVIGAVDCIDSAIFDARSQSRDGIIVGGSDEAGTRAAVTELTALIGQYCVKAPGK